MSMTRFLFRSPACAGVLGALAVLYACSSDTDEVAVTTAPVLYQAVRPSFVQGMHTDAGRVNRFKVMYQKTPPVVETLPEVQQSYSPAPPPQ
ncbi:MAG: hypothetical protein JSW10_11595 [Pseudomonadota bacterium]|nr:MAG: hypothetical protein JSW10_11595 [Pseudomonadota bacterium]